ncbi:hypothetical protein [Rhodoferax saidenbachensis]|uniref:DUF4123 domain-containing protein n=1 Tax=Rhodoferax saidenbachensis TaxID=1484693 RepID=A0ABU1ZHL3_9BURK|nr:hypothetical protein [Rhodoferax saidenbachensis]MDR7305032.1 hypothetical protein [Rhodoferax saidenbachensis]
MSRLVTEFSRLYLVSEPELPEQGHLVGANATVKAMVLEIARPADWTDLSLVWSGAQSDWELPAAGIAVSGTDGLQLWFSVAEPVKAQDAVAFLSALQNKYLSTTPAKRIALYPSGASATTGDITHAKAVPAAHAGTGNWSAFVSPDLASVFGEEPWLDLPPNPDQQADILSRLRPMKTAQFYDVLNLLGVTLNHAASAAEPMAPTSRKMGPKEFLAQVMNDPAVGLKDRIEAAKALLPYTS